MDRNVLRRALESADLTAYQASAYLALVENGRLPAVEVARRSSVPSSQVYDALRELEGMGLVDTVEREKLHAQPRDPAEVLSRLRERGELLSEAADELEDRWERPDPSDYRINVVTRAETVVDRVRERLRDASVIVEAALSVSQLESLAPGLVAAAERGVVVRASVYWTADVGERCRDLGLAGSPVDLRVVRIPGPFLAILDRRSTHFTPGDRADETYGVFIEDEILSFIAHWYHQTCLWTPWSAPDGGEGSAPTYVSLEEFVQDAVPLRRAGATVTVTVEGRSTATGSRVTLRGTVAGLYYPKAESDPNAVPSLERLAGFTTAYVDAADGRYAVGGWGAVFEDVEALTVEIDDVTFPPAARRPAP